MSVLVIFVLGVSVFVGPFIVAGVACSSFDSFAFVRVLARSLLYLALGVACSSLDSFMLVSIVLAFALGVRCATASC